MSAEIPSHKEIRDCLGPTLADAFFELSNPSIKTLLGLEPPLRGPSEGLWHSPSDRAIEKNCLKPPTTNSITRDATHRGILELGEKALRRHEENLEKKIRESLLAEINDVHLLLEAEQRHVTNTRIKKIENECTRRINLLTKEFDEQLEKALENVITRYNKVLQKAVVETRMNVTLEMMKKMRKEVDFIVTDLSAEYERRSCIQRDNMICDFNEVMRKERTKMRDSMNDIQRRKAEDIEVIRCRMENEFRENTLKAVRCERSNCDNQKREICENYEKTVDSLKELLENANNKIQVTEEKPAVIIPPNDDLWKSKIHHILEEFKKFIQFALKCSPKHADFLLPRESLLRFPTNEKL